LLAREQSDLKIAIFFFRNEKKTRSGNENEREIYTWIIKSLLVESGKVEGVIKPWCDQQTFNRGVAGCDGVIDEIQLGYLIVPIDEDEVVEVEFGFEVVLDGVVTPSHLIGEVVWIVLRNRLKSQKKIGLSEGVD